MRVQLDACKDEKLGLKTRVKEQLTAHLAVERQQRDKMQTLSQVLPSCNELADFLAVTLPDLRPGMEVTVPIQALRWTHDGINAQLAFGDNHEHAEESIFKLFEQLFRERVMPLDLTEADPLPVFLHRGPDNHLGLYSRRNRRLATLLMYQALRREELVKVHVFVSPDDPSDIPRWQRDWQICRIDGWHRSVDSTPVCRRAKGFVPHSQRVQPPAAKARAPLCWNPALIAELFME